MFILYNLEDRILLKPDDLNLVKAKFYEDIVLEKLKEKYIGKVLFNHGIVVTIKKLVIKNNLIVETEGVINVEYDCDLIVLRPIEGDILYGKIMSADENCIMLNCEIVKVKVPKAKLMSPSYFNQDENVWYWDYAGHKLYYDKEEQVKVKIVEVHFNKPTEDNKTPLIMEVVGVFNQEGLGPIKWWTS